MKATYKGRVKERYSDAVHLLYEYRGYEYMVTDTHDGYMLTNTLAKQHRYEQEQIDKMIEDRSKRKPAENSRTVEEVIDEWYRMVEG